MQGGGAPRHQKKKKRQNPPAGGGLAFMSATAEPCEDITYGGEGLRGRGTPYSGTSRTYAGAGQQAERREQEGRRPARQQLPSHVSLEPRTTGTH